ncbi:MAG: exodeoxyribonuclease III [Candidatus Omnitrophota bacterium]
MKLLSWNINGIRAIEKKGFFEWLLTEPADIVCVQETKADPDILSEKFINPNHYRSYWTSAEKKGYSGVAVFTKKEPDNVIEGLGIPEFDKEGRVLELEYANFILFNIYFPNGSRGNVRVPFKMAFYDCFLKRAESLRKKGKSLIICGDVNTAHQEIDLARPRANETKTGFLPIEREWMTTLFSKGYIDTFRHLNPGKPGHYSWWDYKTGARARDIGWRIDYFIITPDLLPKLKDAFIQKDVMGSDHCPVGIDLSIKF